MRLTATHRVELGAKLGRDIPNPVLGGSPLLRAGTALTANRRDALLRAGIVTVYVDDALGAGIEVPEPLREETRREAMRVVSSAFESLPDTSGATIPAAQIDELARVAALLAAEIAACDEAAFALTDLASADAYTLQHSLDVTVLGLILGRRLFYDAGRIDYRGARAFDNLENALTRLGLGLLLHDVGKLTIPKEILHKPGPLDDAEWEVMRRHPLVGLELLTGDSIGPTSKAVVRSHHERWDGGGYPDGRAGNDIHQFARIAAVADVFDAITSQRAYSKGAPQWAGVDAIVGGSGTAFDPEVVDVFQLLVVPYPPGSEIVLADGRSGVVVDVPRDRPDRPLVRIGFAADGARVDPYEIALEDEPDLDLLKELEPAAAAARYRDVA